MDEGGLDLGSDGRGFVQELTPRGNGQISRVETLGGNFLYAIDIFTAGKSFNLCPAEICQVESVPTFLENDAPNDPELQLRVRASTPSHSVIRTVEKIVALGGIDAGGIEYIVDERDGRALFYDINVLSNFVADAPQIIGFNPHARLVAFLEQQPHQQ